MANQPDLLNEDFEKLDRPGEEQDEGVTSTSGFMPEEDRYTAGTADSQFTDDLMNDFGGFGQAENYSSPQTDSTTPVADSQPLISFGSEAPNVPQTVVTESTPPPSSEPFEHVPNSSKLEQDNVMSETPEENAAVEASWMKNVDPRESGAGITPQSEYMKGDEEEEEEEADQDEFGTYSLGSQDSMVIHDVESTGDQVASQSFSGLNVDEILESSNKAGAAEAPYEVNPMDEMGHSGEGPEADMPVSSVIGSSEGTFQDKLDRDVDLNKYYQDDSQEIQETNIDEEPEVPSTADMGTAYSSMQEKQEGIDIHDQESDPEGQSIVPGESPTESGSHPYEDSPDEGIESEPMERQRISAEFDPHESFPGRDIILPVQSREVSSGFGLDEGHKVSIEGVPGENIQMSFDNPVSLHEELLKDDNQKQVPDFSPDVGSPDTESALDEGPQTSEDKPEVIESPEVNKEVSCTEVLELMYWKDVKKTGVVFSSMVFVLISLMCFSLMSVVAYLALAVLTVTFTFRLYKSAMQAVQKTSEGHPFKKFLEMDLDLKHEVVEKAAENIVKNLNNTLRELRRLFLVEDIVDSLKFGMLLYLLTYIGSWFNGMTLVLLAVVAIFTLPKVYETYKVQIDSYINLARAQLNKILAQIQSKIPFPRKKEKAQ